MSLVFLLNIVLLVLSITSAVPMINNISTCWF